MTHNAESVARRIWRRLRPRPEPNLLVLHVVLATKDVGVGYVVRRGSPSGPVISHHATLQQGVHYAKSKGVSERGAVVVWGPSGPPTSISYGARIDGSLEQVSDPTAGTPDPAAQPAPGRHSDGSGGGDEG